MATSRFPAIALLAVASTLVLASCTSNGGAEPGPTVTLSPGAPAPAPNEGGGDVTSTWETAVTAVTTAEADAGGRAIEFDAEDDGTFEVHVAVGDREVEVKVGSDGRSVESSRDDDDGLDADDRTALESATTTLADAIRIASAENPQGSALDDVSLDEDDGTWVWDVSFQDSREVRVSVTDGAIVSAGGGS